MKGWVIIATAGTVLAADVITKLGAPTDGWTWHADALHDPSRAGLGTCLATIAGAALVSWAFRSIGFAVALVGVIGNVGFALVTGGTPNPIVDDGLAFNVADVAIQGGGVFGALEISWWVATTVVAARDRRAILRSPTV